MYTGTISKKRVGLPTEIHAPFRLGDNCTMQFRGDRVMVQTWRARSKKVPVIIISSSLPASLTEVQNRRGKCVKKPLAIDHYNRSMNGVDYNDQHCVYYSFIRRTLKWWRKFLFYMLGCASYLLYKGVTHKKFISLEYRRSIVEALVVEHIQRSGSHPICQSPPYPSSPQQTALFSRPASHLPQLRCLQWTYHVHVLQNMPRATSPSRHTLFRMLPHNG